MKIDERAQRKRKTTNNTQQDLPIGFLLHSCPSMTCKQPRVATETNIQIVLLMVRIILMLNVCKRVLPCRGITEFTSATKPSLQEHSPYLNQLCIAMFQTKPFIISLANHNHAEFHCFSCFFLAALHTLVTSRDTSHVCSVKY